MKRVGLTITAILITLISLFLFYSLRLQEKVQLWTHYSVIYISNEYSPSQVSSVFQDAGIIGVITKEKSVFSVKNRMLPTLEPYENDGFTSESMRDFFFHDESGSFFLLYVPVDAIEHAAEALQLSHIPFGLDASVEYPVLCPILCFAAFILLMFINRIDFVKALCLLPLVAVSYAVPFYSVASAVMCLLFVFCIADIYDLRKGALVEIIKQAALWIAGIAGLVSASLSGKTALLFFITGMVLSGILLNLRYLDMKCAREKYHFKALLIINARWMQNNKRYNMKTLLTMLVVCTCFLFLSLFSDSLTAGINTQDLLLPSPSGYTEEQGFSADAYSELSEMQDNSRNPDLSDFLNEKWYAETAAYRKVYEPFERAKANENIVLPSFVEEDGLIVEKDSVLFSFDDRYISSAANEFDSRDGIEKLLVSEEGFYSTGYAASGKRETSSLIIPATALCAACFLILAVVYCIKRQKK